MRRRCTLLIAMLLTGCALSPLDDGGPTLIRIRNASTVAFEDLRVGYLSGIVEYGTLEAGEATAYRDVGKVYRYAYVSFSSGGRTWSLVPIDYVGETPLDGGRWTYEITLIPEEDALTIEAVRES